MGANQETVERHSAPHAIYGRRDVGLVKLDTTVRGMRREPVVMLHTTHPPIPPTEHSDPKIV